MKRTFYKDGDKYIMATDECPKGFKGVLFVVWEGEIDSLKEGVRTPDQLKKLERVDEVDREWLNAFAQAAGFDAEPDERATTKPKVEPAPSRRDTPLDEFVGHCAVGTDPLTAAVVSGLFDAPRRKRKRDEPAIPVDETFHGVVVCICMLAGIVIYMICRAYL